MSAMGAEKSAPIFYVLVTFIVWVSSIRKSVKFNAERSNLFLGFQS